ncbi:uncharacterized protein isoform X11 [Musca autumnalis]|uniref:uncharacterized protein isoform X11 n=1 Tax=Musca autumnalis TaxID=221902 RepID=UPI003CE927FA
MQDVLLYISAFFMIFLSCAIVCFCLRFSMWIYMEYWSPQQMQQHHPYARRCQMRDRQANVFTIHDETSRESRYNDIFFIEPNSVEAARIRAQLEKDDKDLPSYEEVMRMTSINPTTTTSAVAGMTASNASVNTTETILSVPPYSEVDPMTSASSSGNATSTAGGTGSSATTTASTRTSQPPPMPAAMVSSSVDITQQSSSIV